MENGMGGSSYCQTNLSVGILFKVNIRDLKLLLYLKTAKLDIITVERVHFPVFL